MLGVLGVLLSENGKLIKQEMLVNLKQHQWIAVEQEMPGKRYEYPAIKYAMNLSIETNEPVLYLHTKGAFNTVPIIPKIPGRKSIDTFMPKNATLKDWQPTVRKMWYHEFGQNIDKYIDVVKQNKPIVACPYTGNGKATWQNGFIMNSLAAKELNKIFKFTSNRYWYEVMWNECKDVEVKGIINDKINSPLDDSRFELYKSIWSFFEG